jgi:PAS domain S-box-containing protein
MANRKTGGPKDLLGGLRTTFILTTAGLLFIALAVVGLHALDRRLLASAYQTRELLKVARQAKIIAMERATAVTGYRATGAESARGSELASRKALADAIDSLVILSADNSSRKDRAAGVKKSVQRWERGYALDVLTPGSRFGTDAVDATAGRELFNAVNAALGSVISSEERVYARRVALEDFVQRVSVIGILVMLAFVIVVSATFCYRLGQQARQVIEQQEQLEEQAVELENQAAELEEQAVQLEEQNELSRKDAENLSNANVTLSGMIHELEQARIASTEAAAERKRTQSLLNFVLESSPVGFGLFDRDYRITMANEAMAVLNDMPVAKLLGKAPRDLVDPELAGNAEALLQGVIDTGRPVLNVSLSGSIASDPARKRHYLVNYFPVRRDETEVAGVGVVVLDVTDRKSLEESVRQSQKMEAVGRLAGGVAHDFNNLLTAIRSYSELLMADISPERAEYADVVEIKKAAERASDLTRQLLAFSRQQVLRAEPMDLNACVMGLFPMLTKLVGSSILMETNLDAAVGSVMADQAEIERVIVNLVLNARDAMPRGGTLTIETADVEMDAESAAQHEAMSPGRYVQLSVGDNGIGMTSEVREKLFEPFFTTKERLSSTGLGLSSIYGIVKQSGGHISVETERLRGTVFRVYLPMAEASLTAVVPPAVNESGGGERILLVEDDDVVRCVAGRILRKQGFTVVEAENGRIALDRFRAPGFKADLVVTDLAMPEMGGSELASHIRSICPDARILFTSGYTEDRAVRENLIYPGADFLEKPFTPGALVEKARLLLDSRSLSVPL